MFYALGLFAFDMPTLLFADLERDRTWRHPETETFGGLPSTQYVGPGTDTIFLGGMLVPEICGTYSSIEKLAAMAEAGDAYPLVRGDGKILGNFIIRRLNEKHANMLDNGKARSVEFTLDLARVPDA
ncbi:phage tail protein [Novosphingobium sp. KACC 22771]|uniref:phage tail protein n=1 Tax=Novosphingobium sp. KACC 22771 TaxID=3025670 RepID=UPI002366E94F|nr:phage tail protein [Novosphingobium sp. KACC 22771]WDF71494.1 phage tail protein [Novosphingobium sp. KACC 22771]